MEKYIQAIMATFISFLTCIAPVYAMEGFIGIHSLDCELHSRTKTIELSGMIFGKTAYLAALKDGENQEYKNIEVSRLPRSNNGIMLNHNEFILILPEPKFGTAELSNGVYIKHRPHQTHSLQCRISEHQW